MLKVWKQWRGWSACVSNCSCDSTVRIILKRSPTNKILSTNILLYRVIENDCRGFNNLSYTIHLRQQYVFAPMDQEILKVFFYDVRCAVVMHFSAWNAVY